MTKNIRINVPIIELWSGFTMLHCSWYQDEIE